MVAPVAEAVVPAEAAQVVAAVLADSADLEAERWEAAVLV